MPGNLIIRNAAVIDGTGAPAFAADVGVEGDRIAFVGGGGKPIREIDATGLVLTPGFVDVHSHDDMAFIRHPGMEFKLSQGVTSEVSGNCGMSTAPFDPAVPRRAGDLVPASTDWTDLEGYFRACAAGRPAINNAMLVGHNTVRHLVAPNERRRATAAETRRMRALVRQSMEQGAVGLSTGLIYEPGRYSDTDEVVALASECEPFAGLYSTHMRNEGEHLLEAVEEAMTVARLARIPLHISHHKAAGRANWGKVADSLAVVDAANAAGADITLDVYPYTAGSGPMNQYVDLENINVEWASNVLIATCPDFREFEGRMIPAIGRDRGWSIEETVRRVLTGPRGKETLCIHFIIDERDIETNLRHPRVMIGSDGIPELRGRPHPRLFGTMTRVLGVYVRERRVIPLEEAIRRMTSLPCERFGLVDRGLIREGAFADLVLFDPAAVRDEATYEDPKRESTGIRMVVVNGKIAYEDGRHTGTGAGRMLRYRR